MVEPILRRIFPTIFKRVDDKEREIDSIVNRRVAEFIMAMDPFEPLMRHFKVVFGVDYEKPEERLNQQGQLQMKMWGYQQRDDPSFKFFVQWILDTQGNAAIRKGNPTPETILFSRAMIAAPLLMRREVIRLGSLYEEILKEKGVAFDPHVAVSDE